MRSVFGESPRPVTPTPTAPPSRRPAVRRALAVVEARDAHEARLAQTQGVERRTLARAMQVRADGDSPGRLTGYAAVYDSPSDLGYMTEVIAPGAFDEVLKTNPDVRCLFNHDRDRLLGRTASGTLDVSADATGLHYAVTLPDTQQARDLAKLVERGDVNQSSFAFRIGRDEWEYDEDDNVTTRRILEIADLFDVSPVTVPAYSTTTVGLK